MKKYVIACLCLMFALIADAQDKGKFSPEEFEAKLEAYITKKASLSQQEAAKFFPLLKEMHQKQRVIYGRMRKAYKQKPDGNAACAEAVKQCDKLNIELKQIEQNYHNRMLQVLPATKVYDAINAENCFHRQMMKDGQKGKRP